MNHHLEAWEYVSKHLFGTVCEVTRKKPWGFKEDREDIINKTVEEFLSENTRYDTVILHILLGEGERLSVFNKVVRKARENAIKVVVLEHNPEEFGTPKVEFEGIHENWGRNLLYAFTTIPYLELHQLNDEYYKENINKVYVNENDHGICVNNLIYTHTSEEPIDFKLPEGEYMWVIGGGIPLESMREGDVLMDSVLRQCIWTAKKFSNSWKIDRLYKFKEINELKENWKPHWRKVKWNGNKPSKIIHQDLKDLKVENKVIYVSTVHKDNWKHLTNNTILDAWTEPRDTIKCT